MKTSNKSAKKTKSTPKNTTPKTARDLLRLRTGVKAGARPGEEVKK